MKLARLPDGSPEIFHTLQGEGPSTGRPAVFIRAALCNLHCQWCDTDYTWNWEGTPWKHDRDAEEGYHKFKKSEQITELPPSEVATRAAGFDCRHLVLTGGEPLLQQDDFAEVLEQLRALDPSWTAEVETNGTLIPSERLNALVESFNVSPKLSNSGIKKDLRVSTKALAWFAESPKATFKFVIRDEDDLGEATDLRALLGVSRSRVCLMPEGRTPETLADRRTWLADVCRDHGYRFSDRLHLQLWGPARGR